MVSDQADERMLLKRIVEHFLGSSQFNGFFINFESSFLAESAALLVQNGLVEVVSEDDFSNIFILPWRINRPVREKIEAIHHAAEGHSHGVCLYPTPNALKGFLKPEQFQDEPFKRRLAEGHGCLEYAYFKFEVLREYRDDPKFRFSFDDFGVSFHITNSAFIDPNETDTEKTGLRRAGFAYGFAEGKDGPIIRRIVVSLRDLTQLSSLHQQRWQTYEVPHQEGLRPHPVWLAHQMGEWVSSIGPFERFMFELRAWNELHRNAFGGDLLQTTERPREFGWILGPTQHEYDDFIHMLDKLLSENLKPQAFKNLGISGKDEDGKSRGTLARLDLLLKSKQVSEMQREIVLKPFRHVRNERAMPAHHIRQNATNPDFILQQANLLHEITTSLEWLREFWHMHPANKDWQAPDHVQNGGGYKF